MNVTLRLPVAVTVEEPEKPYDKIAIALNITTMDWQPPVDGSLDATVSAVLKPYRVLSTGAVDIAPQSLWRQLSVPSLAAAAGNEALQTAILVVADALQDYIDATLAPPPAPEPAPEPEPEAP